jgi:hypothetical protein
MAENEAVENETAAEVEMCNCGCGHTKEQTIQMLMDMEGVDREEAERKYVEYGEEITDEDKEFRDLIGQLRQAMTQDKAEQERKHQEAITEGQRAKDAGEEMCPCGCGYSRAQVVTGMQENGGLNEEQANALYEKCAAVERVTPGGVTPEIMQGFLNEVVGN